MPALAFLPLFFTGLLAGTHCAGMCGGVVTALSLSGSPAGRPPLARLLAYNAGRVGSYVAAGALAGSVSGGALLMAPQHALQTALLVFANLMLVALGLYLAGWWRAVAYLERAGALLWRRLAPFARRLLPVRSTAQALALGGLWGWLPCGLVYSVLVTAFASGSAADGAFVMFAFGLGTLPNLIALGYFAERLRPLLRHRGVRLTAGLLVGGFGLAGLAGAADPSLALPLLCRTV